MKKVVFLLLLTTSLYGDTWIGFGGGVFFPLKQNRYDFNPGPGWCITVKNQLSGKNAHSWGFLIGVNNYRSRMNNFFPGTSVDLDQNEIQLGLFYQLFRYRMHLFDLSAGYVSKGVEGKSRYQGISQNGNGYFIHLSDNFEISENISLEGRLYWSAFKTDTSWGDLSVNGPGIEILISFRVLSSDD